ncbi:hypothetical protein D3C80_1889830 [compost metagenome]
MVSAGHAIGILPVPLIRDMLAVDMLKTLPCDPAIPAAKFCLSYLTERPDMQLGELVTIIRATLVKQNFLVD